MLMLQKNSHASLCTVNTPHGTNWANTTGEFFFSKRESVTQWASIMQMNLPGAPKGRDIVSRAGRPTCYGKPQLKAGSVVHPLLPTGAYDTVKRL